MTTPTPQTWTLRLKSHKTTVLLHIDPLHTFSTIKSALYSALEQTELRHPDTGAAIPLPPSPSDIQLGRPLNINDAHEGFKLGEWEYSSSFDEGVGEEVEGKGKGKAKATGAGGKGVASAKMCPKGAGLKDGAVLAFRWVGDGNWEGEEEEDEDEDGEGGGRGREGDMWGVRLASFEDAYGVENEGDVGGGREFEG
ncbi:hypothetical protein COCMIDRAFT_81434 [Bipolaris oryzae ATCC 44560]|uniref:Uncharacterized protein n=1 Tax=Bipolaris oryzae ATCC 44560 TaxID=930090 RepID=W6ZFT7_COCMI|nr:uncharacterized protein COCMIDRAFT_81434 [Bipolaris oryzae ATCC 44560]EUC50667.1 hypothetical protein COCMIDRAFT_81434 [Bipolaris oryzae ATCC 44560]